MDIDIDILLSEKNDKNDKFKKIIAGCELIDNIKIDSAELVDSNSGIKNCKSIFANDVLENGKIPNEYFKLKEEVDERYNKIETRLSSNL